ncbi:MAG: pyridoxamine 5'-phosphate oxidase family protein [bacterium]|jgi:general stress protein 26|nr:pyridoxamine 5'-phosphate oxidase family protein [bacterium]
MSNPESRKLAESILQNRSIFFMATVERGTPRVRPMTCLYADGFKIWTCSRRNTPKMEQIKQHNEVECCFLDENQRQVRILGTVKVYEDEKAWNDLPFSPESIPMLEDPEYQLLLIEPQEIRFIDDWSVNYKKIQV